MREGNRGLDQQTDTPTVNTFPLPCSSGSPTASLQNSPLHKLSLLAPLQHPVKTQHFTYNTHPLKHATKHAFYPREPPHMVSSSRHSRTSSPPPSIAHSTSSALSTHQQKLNIVSRLSIEGKAKRGSDGRTDGASIRIYLKVGPIPIIFTRLYLSYSFHKSLALSPSPLRLPCRFHLLPLPCSTGLGLTIESSQMAIPQDSVTPGATIPLFPGTVPPWLANPESYQTLHTEENLKIFNSQVHPLDSTSAPYHFSSSTCPLLHRASTALSLPVRIKLPYNSVFGSTSSSSSASNAPPVDEAYTGVIIVSGYHVSFVLPKEFPPRNSPYESRNSSRRSSTPLVMQFMAAIEAWVPFLTKPPSSPYLVSFSLHLSLFFPSSSSSFPSPHLDASQITSN